MKEQKLVLLSKATCSQRGLYLKRKCEQRAGEEEVWQQHFGSLEGNQVCIMKARSYCNPQGRLSKTN